MQPLSVVDPYVAPSIRVPRGERRRSGLRLGKWTVKLYRYDEPVRSHDKIRRAIGRRR
jgi:hypothetical protein